MGRKNKSELRKPEILEHFLRVFMEEGIEGASIAKIAKHMDVHPSLIMHYFKTKEEMVIDLADLMFEKVIKPGLEELKAIDDIDLRFKKVMEKILFREENDKEHARLMPSIFYLATRHEIIKERLINNIMYVHEIFCQELQVFMDHEIIKKDDPDELLNLLSMIGSGYLHHIELFGLDEAEKLKQQIWTLAMSIAGYKE